jgi:Sugar transferases involved in lipopolysaccharide synthesis
MLDARNISIGFDTYTPSVPISAAYYKKGTSLYILLKRMFDIIASLFGLIFLSPVFGLIALLIKLDDGGSVIHTRICVGNNYRPYKMYKFRTMRMDADKLDRWFTPGQMEQYRKECKLNDDPRITKIGRLLRSSSLDELPQLMSVFKGDMSIVGPRPLVGSELANYGINIEKVLLTKAGITGYWQVNGRSNCTYESGERQKLELFYIDNRSFWLDIKILLKTFTAVLSKAGAK